MDSQQRPWILIMNISFQFRCIFWQSWFHGIFVIRLHVIWIRYCNVSGHYCQCTGTFKNSIPKRQFCLIYFKCKKWSILVKILQFDLFQIALDTTYWTVFNHITIWGSILVYFLLQFVSNFLLGGKYIGSLYMVRIYLISIEILS